MTAGIPLEDADRWEWLARLRKAAVDSLVDNAVRGVVMTCSALKQKYRDAIRVANIEHRVSVRFYFLQADRKTLNFRVSRRKDHFMASVMVDSQLRDLEPVGKGETDIAVVDVRGGREKSEALVAAAVKNLLSS